MFIDLKQSTKIFEKIIEEQYIRIKWLIGQ